MKYVTNTTWDALKLKTHDPTLILKIVTLRPIIKTLFLVGFTSIVLTSFWPNLFTFFGDEFKTFIEIWVKISYSIVAATLFYFINQHSPKFDKRVKSYFFELSRITDIRDHIHEMLSKVATVSPTGIDSMTLYEETNSLEPKSPFIVGGNASAEFPTWKDYIVPNRTKLKEKVNQLLTLQDTLDDKTFEYLLMISEGCEQFERSEQSDGWNYLAPYYKFNEIWVELGKILIDRQQPYRQVYLYELKRREAHMIYPGAYQYRNPIGPFAINTFFALRAFIVVEIILSIILVHIT